MVSGWNIDKSRAAWWSIGAVLGLATLFVVYSFIGTFVFGLFLYYATRPVYRRLKRRIRPPSLAAGIALLALALPAILLIVYTLAIAVQELTAVAQTTNIASLPEPVRQYANVSEIAQHPEQFITNGNNSRLIEQAFGSTLRYLTFIGNGALHLFVMIAIAFYLLRDDHKLSRWFRRTFSDSEGVLETYIQRVDTDFNSIFFGNILNAFMTGTIGAISYNMLNMVAPAGLGIPYPTVVGLLTGVASLIPVVGMKLVYFPVTVVVGANALMDGGPDVLWFPVVFALVSFVIVDTIPDLVLRPYVSGRNLHVGMVMFAYIFGPLLFGWYGIFLGPMILVLVVHFVEVVLPELIAGRPIQPWAVDPTYIRGDEPLPQPPRDPEEAVSADMVGDGGNAEDETKTEGSPPEPTSSDDESTK
ncbi:Predicted PurR-regulated permease PerM [Haladaptatus litoreus]|uniref:Predicted PurR-regulated permease PerM n=1 Tax=Haladaptatus litoreus TaxID=553468 RepID=A0A1N6Z9L0_9EURY|nr:AI-2E family transporter [Haladaptatus litoreus]SIR23468.1 Predicted PurR-regulated permease PerM [Haladaptatus litoreus]